ncbi:hypothetical protein Tco_0464568 [Tanacetum coccineum]
MSWGWRKVLQLRPLIREFVWYSLGAGSQASAWFDRWCPLGPLSLIVSSRDIHRAGFNMGSRVRDIVADGVWKWPPEWYIKYPMLGTVVVPVLNPEARDVLEWRVPGGVSQAFSVWDHLKVDAGLQACSASLDDIILHVLPFAKRRQARSIIAKLVIAACSYFIWQERNWRLFKNKKRSLVQVIDCIKSSVRLKLLTCSFKKSNASQDLIDRWKLPGSLIGIS